MPNNKELDHTLIQVRMDHKSELDGAKTNKARARNILPDDDKLVRTLIPARLDHRSGFDWAHAHAA